MLTNEPYCKVLLKCFLSSKSAY